MPAAAGTDPVNLGWQADAACTSSDPELWFPSKGTPAATARIICNGCPVKPECLEYALDLHGINGVQIEGIWAGTNQKERQRMLVGRRRCKRCLRKFQAEKRVQPFCSEECRAAQRAESLANKDRRYDQFSRTGP